MRVIIRHRTSGSFYDANGNWSDVEKEAMEFRTSVDALRHCREQNLQESEILLSFNDAVLDISLPCNQQKITAHAADK